MEIDHKIKEIRKDTKQIAVPLGDECLEEFKKIRDDLIQKYINRYGKKKGAGHILHLLVYLLYYASNSLIEEFGDLFFAPTEIVIKADSLIYYPFLDSGFKTSEFREQYVLKIACHPDRHKYAGERRNAFMIDVEKKTYIKTRVT